MLEMNHLSVTNRSHEGVTDECIREDCPKTPLFPTLSVADNKKGEQRKGEEKTKEM